MWIKTHNEEWVNSDFVSHFALSGGDSERNRSVIWLNNRDQIGYVTSPLQDEKAQAKLSQIIKAIQGGARVFEFEEQVDGNL